MRRKLVIVLGLILISFLVWLWQSAARSEAVSLTFAGYSSGGHSAVFHLTNHTRADFFYTAIIEIETTDGWMHYDPLAAAGYAGGVSFASWVQAEKRVTIEFRPYPTQARWRASVHCSSLDVPPKSAIGRWFRSLLDRIGFVKLGRKLIVIKVVPK